MTGFAEVAEHLRAVIATYAQAQDDGRADELADLYCVDGTLEVPGMGVYEGRETIRATWRQWAAMTPADRLHRHLVSNTVIERWDEHEASTRSDVVRLNKGESGWVVDVVARYHDTFRNTPEGWRLLSRRDEFFGWSPPPSAG